MDGLDISFNLEKEKIPIDISIISEVFEKGIPHNIGCPCSPDVANNPLIIASAPFLPSRIIYSALVMRLHNPFTNKSFGTLVLWNINDGKYNWFTSWHVKEFGKVSNHIAYAIEKSFITDEKIRAARELREIERRLVYAGALLANVVHDLRNEFNDLLSDLRQLVDKTQNYKEKELASRAEDTCKWLAIRTNEYLEAISHSGSLSVSTKSELEPIILLPILNEISDMRKELKVEIVLDIIPRVWINASVIELQMAFRNLIHNAVKYTGIGYTKKGGKIKISAGIIESDRQVCIMISDEGIGIPEEEIPEILNGIFKKTPTGRPAMGIFLANSIIKEHGGSLNINANKMGHGTTVIVKLPYISIERSIADG
jgi:signal transduction histidine kinase